MTGTGVPAPTEAEPSLVEAGGLRIDATPSGPTASVRTPDGRWIRLHSGRDPVAEADRAVADLLGEPAPPLVVIIGVGLGHLLDAIGRRSPSTRVLAVEPLHISAEALRARQTCRDWLASGRLTLLAGPDYAGAGEAWRALNGTIDAPLVVSPVLEREFPAEVARAREVVAQVRFGARANAEARRTFAPRYLLNTIRNVPVIAGSSDVAALTNRFPGVPAVVVAAGPSLDRNLKALRQTRGRVLLIAVDTALRPLLEAGIEPELVVAVDPSAINARHLRHLPDTRRTWLVAEASLDPGAFEAFAGRTFTFSVSDHEPWPWLRSVGLGRGRLRAWGSVLTSAVDLALQAGCDPIVFAGADLAHTGGQPYCRGTVYEHDWAEQAALGEPVTSVWARMRDANAQLSVADVHGWPVATSSALLAFRDWIVQESVSHPGRRFINGTGGGVLAGGRLEQRDLLDVLSDMRPQLIDGHGAVADRWRVWRHAHGSSISGMTRALAEIRHADDTTEPITAWLRFAEAGLSANELFSALADAADGLSAPPSTAAQLPILLAGGAPERVHALRAVIASERPVCVLPAPAGAPASDTRDPGDSMLPTGRILAELVRLADPLLGPEALAREVLPSPAPASRSFPWNAEAVGAAHAFESALAAVVTGPDLPHGRIRGLEVHVRTAALDGPAPPPPSHDGQEVAARLRLVADWLSVAAAVEGEPHARIHRSHDRDLPLRVASALVRAYANAAFPGPTAAPGDESALLDVSLDRYTCALPCTGLAPAWAHALTGTLLPAPAASGVALGEAMALPALSITVPVGGASDSLSVSLGVRTAAGVTAGVTPGVTLVRGRSVSGARWVPPIRVNPPSPGCMVGSAYDQQHALFTVVNGTRSIRVDAQGHWTEGPAWPSPIVGEVRWGATGSVAWHNARTSRVHWRQVQDGEVHTEDIPFTACLAFPQPDGSIWWTSFEGGLWAWAPGRTWQRLADTPPVMGLVETPDGIELHPSGEDPTFAARPGVTSAFRWRPGQSTVVSIPLGPDGPCWSVSSRDGWAAMAYPYGNLIQLGHASGVRHALACDRPFNVAWAGASLVASTRRGELLLFHDLLSILEAPSC